MFGKKERKKERKKEKKERKKETREERNSGRNMLDKIERRKSEKCSFRKKD